MLAKLNSTIEQVLKIPIPDNRKVILDKFKDYIQNKLEIGETPRLNFICTHNSRRSQFSQIWAQTAAAFFAIDVECFSGGVELTAFNERAVASILRCGFKVEKEGEINPKYSVYYDTKSKPIVAFSKLFDDTPSPFAAVMTCAHADENCPFIPAAECRIPVRYDDPKAFDDTALEAEKYDERSIQIASEMFYVFRNLANKKL
ncbi:protein-tyrosine-phosphatase [Flavobacteriaceae bacterium]|jgi:arsenate reductase|nr:protein-tyrosine-phosphatase [Flavobacteriaceae bacterium]